MLGRPFVASLEGNVYCCSICTAHLAMQGDLLSKVTPPVPQHCYGYVLIWLFTAMQVLWAVF